MKKLLLLFTAFYLSFSAISYCKDKITQSFPLPGNSLADPILQRDTFKPIWAMTHVIDKSCNDINVIDTKVIQLPQNLVKENGKYVGGEWSEIWRVNYCGKTKDYPIVFILDKTGATYKISNN